MERLLGLPPRERACGAARPIVFPRRSCGVKSDSKVSQSVSLARSRPALTPPPARSPAPPLPV